MARAYGEWHGNMIIVEHAVQSKPESLQNDVIPFRPQWILVAQWGSICCKTMRQRKRFFQILTEFKRMTALQKLCKCSHLIRISFVYLRPVTASWLQSIQLHPHWSSSLTLAVLKVYSLPQGLMLAGTVGRIFTHEAFKLVVSHDWPAGTSTSFNK